MRRTFLARMPARVPFAVLSTSQPPLPRTMKILIRRLVDPQR